MEEKKSKTYWVRLFLSGPIETAKTILREECMREGLCVTIEPTQFIYTGGEEAGYVVGIIQYPRFPTEESVIWCRAEKIAKLLMKKTHQWSALAVSPSETKYFSCREISDA